MSVSYVPSYICVRLLTQSNDSSIITHHSVLSLFDEEGLSILSQLHVQTHRLAINFYVHLQDRILVL